MADKVTKEAIRIRVLEDCTVDRTPVRAGVYPGYKKTLYVSFMGKKAPLEPEYFMILSEDDVKYVDPDTFLIGMDIRCDEELKSGLLKIV
ncbi:hypothetical protein [Brucella anthropi]|uniref:hypothetical protein n=1 Tax=Brucella anthropi TaxID=529 RepID=UPI00384B76E8